MSQKIQNHTTDKRYNFQESATIYNVSIYMIQTNMLDEFDHEILVDNLKSSGEYIKIGTRHYIATTQPIKEIVQTTMQSIKNLKQVKVLEIDRHNVYGFKHLTQFNKLASFIKALPIGRFFNLRELPTSFE